MYKHFWCYVRRSFDVEYKFKISGPKYLFLWCLVLTKKWVQNSVYRNGFFFYYGIDWNCARSLHFTLLAFFIGLSYQETQGFLYRTLISRNAALSLLDLDIKKCSAFFIGFWYQEMQCFVFFPFISTNAVLSVLHIDRKKRTTFFIEFS